MIKMAEKDKVEGKLTGVPLSRVDEVFGSSKGKVSTTRKLHDTSGMMTSSSIRRQKTSQPKPTPKPSKDTEDMKLFLHVVGTNFKGVEYIKKFADLPLERISKVHNSWFRSGRDDIAVSHIDLNLSTAQYERALNWIQGIVIMKASEEPTESLSKKILNSLHLR